MPVYEYECRKCGTKKEVIKSLKDIDRLEICQCEYTMIRLCGNIGGFRLKGGGWAEDGYSEYIGDINKTRLANGKPKLTYEDIHGPVK